MSTEFFSRTLKRTLVAAAGASLLAGAGVVAAAPAHAATPEQAASVAAASSSFAAQHPDYYQLVNTKSNKVLDMNNFDINPGGKAIQWGAATSNKNQHWFFRATADGYTEIVNRNSGLVLTLGGDRLAINTPIVQTKPTGAAEQKWAISTRGAGFLIQNGSSSLALTVRGAATGDGADIVQDWYSGTTYQEIWKLVKVADGDFASSSFTAGNYTVRSAHTGYVLDVSENRKSAGTKLIQWSSHGGVNQQWSFRTLYGKTQIFNRSSGLLAAVSGASLAEGASVIQWGNDHVADQRWAVEPVPGKANTYTITNDNSGKRLAVSRLGLGDTPYDIIQSAPTGGTEQQWVITPAS